MHIDIGIMIVLAIGAWFSTMMMTKIHPFSHKSLTFFIMCLATFMAAFGFGILYEFLFDKSLGRAVLVLPVITIVILGMAFLGEKKDEEKEKD